MLKDYEFWFVVGSQFLYGPEVLETVAARAQEMADRLNASGNLPMRRLLPWMSTEELLL